MPWGCGLLSKLWLVSLEDRLPGSALLGVPDDEHAVGALVGRHDDVLLGVVGRARDFVALKPEKGVGLRGPAGGPASCFGSRRSRPCAPRRRRFAAVRVVGCTSRWSFERLCTPFTIL